ncbi:uncharacterized protein LOC134221185 [Armigeres subalbatus]|uniref:uncharacterized protein LOC134221185 n=1 Tax=Armigeres subalbatus TaxID=124917 RepID=UPI002ED24F66
MNRNRRWEALGKAWKYISGSPDAEDLKIINVTTNSLIDQNDRQIRINIAIEHRLKNITEKLNSLIKYQGNFTAGTLDGFDSINLLFNLDELIYQQEIIEEAVTLARRNIPSSRIINSSELITAKKFLSHDGLEQHSMDSILDIASVYVIYSKDMIIYTLKIPRIKNVIYKLNFIEPVVQNNLKIQLHANYYLDGPTPYLFKTPCSKAKDMFICSSTQTEPMTECIQQLTTGKPAYCNVERTYGKNFIKRVDDANIVVNAADLLMSSNCSAQERKLQGSFLIQFQQCTLKLDDEEYANHKYDAQPHSFIPTTGLKVTPVKFINRLPLELLQEQHLEHRDNIAHLNLTTESIHWKINLFGWLSFGTFSTLTIIIIIVIIVGVLKFITWKRFDASAFPQSAKAKQQPEEGKTSEVNVEVSPTRYPRLIPQP